MPSTTNHSNNNNTTTVNSTATNNNSSSSIPNFTGAVTEKKISDTYHIISKIGEGISGSVFKGIKKDTNEEVALKKFKEFNDRSSREECSLLLQLKHIKYITPVIDIYTNIEANEQVVVFPYFEHDLSGLLSEHRFSIPQVKCYFKQLLQGMAEIHKNGIMHRDIKAANLLVNNKGSLFIGDLGTATSYVKRNSFSSKVVTLWYRAPELLLGASQYGPEIDLWSVGCVLIELATSRNFLPGNSEQQQMEVIAKLCGTPTEEVWEGVSTLPNYQSLVGSCLPAYQSKLRQVFKNFQSDFVELLEGLLTLNPKKRLTAQQALASPFFTNQPLPFDLESMPGYQPIHVLEAVQKRLQASEKAAKEQKDRETKELILRQQKEREIEARKKKERLEQLARESEEAARKQQEAARAQQKIFEELKRQEMIKAEKEKMERELAQQHQGRANLKRSLEIVNDIRNYCTTETDESDCDCDDCCDDDDDNNIDEHHHHHHHHHHQVVEVVEVVEDVGDDDYFTDDDDDETDNSDSEYCSGHYNHFNLTPLIKQNSSANNIGKSNDNSYHSNPFLQPPKKQRTTSSTSSSNSSSNNFTNLSTPLIIH